MRPASFPIRARILAAFGVVMLIIVILSSMAAWRLRDADRLATDLVADKLVRQQLAAGLIAEARLQGLTTVAIARSDSLEVADYFQAQLAQGAKQSARLMAALANMPQDPDERALIAGVERAQSVATGTGAEILKQKDMGRTQEVETQLAASLQPALARHAAALQALLERETR
jgi:methyl-accepting chemotaxis protein